MAASLYSNSQHVSFESVLTMEDPGMISMFRALIASGLEGFLGCPAVIYESELVEFFNNGSVQDDLVVSSMNGLSIEISEQLLAETFELPVDGLSELSEMPKDKIFDARSIVSLSGEPVSLSGGKNQKKIEFRLLCDIMAKAISVKAGSFNAITIEKFSLITAIVCGVRMNWANILFSILKKMVTPGSKQAKGFAVQISLLLESFHNLGLGESSEFPSSKILTDKTIQRYIAIIDKSGEQEPVDAPKVKKAPKTKVASKKRPADFSLDVPVLKNKRTSKRKSALETMVVAQDAVPIQSVPVSPAVEPMVEDQQAEFCQEQPAYELPADKSAASTEERHWFDLSYDELIAKWAAERQITSPADSYDEIEDDKPAVDDPDTIINQVLQHLDSTSADKNVEPEEEAATMGVVTAGEDQHVQEFLAQNTNADLLDDDEQKSLEDILLAIPVDVPLPSAGMEITKIVMGQEIKIPGVTEKTWFLSSLPQIPVDHKGKFCSVFVDFSLFNRLPSTDISDFLSSIALDRTALRSVQRSFAQSVVPSVQFSLDQRPSSPTTADSSSSLHFDPTDVDATASSLPPVSQNFSAALADLQDILSEQINESQSGISSKLHKIEQGFRDSLNEQAVVVKKLFQEACQEGLSIDDVQTMRFNEFRKNILSQNASIFVGLADVRKETMRFNEFRKNILSQNASIFVGLADVRKEVQEVNAKVDIMASRLNDVQKDAEATKEALSHQLFEFQSQAQENQNILHAQLSELVDYIHRGSADKKGESGSRGPQQTSNVQIEGSAVRTQTFAQRVEMAQRHIVHTVLDADANRELLERQAAAERDRERRRREARMLKRRRRD
ncbi:dystroglycan-like [Dorcoceras hygrometricum]|uniref:Dystroglycan-like n=1 Tax=Dorcoceras hygrometricum TaxID=472368 RepID=A0A2Z7CNB5_9LAMI|nr:dystroglycan-like [Dorcoceras hygrometricum]